jgi:hypothetical protein
MWEGNRHRLNTSANKRSREEVIENWMLSIFKNGGIARFDDLRIHVIDSSWEQRARWVEGGLEAFRLAQTLRDRHDLPSELLLHFRWHPTTVHEELISSHEQSSRRG